MGIRGRKSGQHLALVAANPIEVLKRPVAPAELTDEQAEEWRAVVDRLPAEWFPRETWSLLTQFCRHVVNARKVAQLIDQAETGDQIDIAQYDKLLAMQEREGRAISSLATRMRLTQQATYAKDKKKSGGEAANPWIE